MTPKLFQTAEILTIVVAHVRCGKFFSDEFTKFQKLNNGYK